MGNVLAGHVGHMHAGRNGRGDDRYLPVHREFHFGFVVRDRGVDLFKLHAELGVDVPAKGGAEETSAEVVHAIFGVAEHDCEVFRYVVEQHVEWVQFVDDGLVLQEAVVEDVAF